MKNYRVYLSLYVLLCSFIAQSSPLKFVPQTITQPTGEIIHCYASGDEYYHWLHDKDGFTILQDANGFYVYAVRVNDKLVPSSNVVGKSDPNGLRIGKWMLPDKNSIREKIGPMIGSQSQLQKIATVGRTVFAPGKGAMTNVVIFIRFSDDGEFTENPSFFNSMLNDTAATANSLRNYYNEVSYGKLQITSVCYPLSSGNSITSYCDPNPRYYYNSYSATNPIGYSTSLEKTEREHTLLMNAINAVKNAIPPSVNIDADQDGNVDNVCFIVKGSPEVWGDILWPHMWSLDSKNIFINGKKVTTYNFHLESEVNVGVLCHEMFHSIGAPDLYHYSLDGMSPVAEWDLMEATTNPPQHMGAYMKYRYGHWLDSIPEITNAGTYFLHSLTSSKNNCVKISSPNSGQEYFVLEYRKKQGVFERSLPSEGVLAYRVNKTSDGLGNANVLADEVYIYRPGGSRTDNGEPDNAALSENSGRSTISDLSDPASLLSDGMPGGLSVFNIGSIADSIRFSLTQPTAYKLALTSPAGGENFKMNSQTLITWVNSSVADIKLELSLDGITWDTIATVSGQSAVMNGQYLWMVSRSPTAAAKIRISDAHNPEAYSVSRNSFTISIAGQLYEQEPNDDNAHANPIAVGDMVEGDITPIGDADYYTFAATAGDTIDVFANAMNSGLWGRIQVFDNSGFITYGDGRYNGLMTNDRLSVLIPHTGVYYIRYAFRDNWGPGVPASLIAPVQGGRQNSKAGVSVLGYNTYGKYQISLRKFHTTPPDFSGDGGTWSLTENSASFYWNVQENGCASKYTFEYGLSNYYGSEIDQRATEPLPTYQENDIQSPNISGLMPNTTYHFRIKAVNSFGTFYSKDDVFTTAQESVNWERQLANWDGGFFKFFTFNANEGLTVSHPTSAGAGLFKTLDGGRTWSGKIAFPDDMVESGASFISINTGWIVGNFIYKTVDGGVTWTKLNDPTTKQLTSVCFVDGNNGWAVGAQGVIIHTSDGGSTWNVQDPGSLSGMWESLMAVEFCDLNTGLAVGTSGLILKTTDGGSTWTKQASGAVATINGVHMMNPLTATVLGDGPCGGAGNILRTNDGGATWTNQNNPTGEYLYSVDYLDAKNGIGVGIDGAIAKTTDGGSTWIRQESGVRSVLRDVKFISPSSAIIVGDWGVILKTIDLSSKSVALKSPQGTEVWKEGSVQNILWQKNNISAINLSVTTDKGTTWHTIAKNIPASFNTYSWLVPNTTSDDCRIKITDAADSTNADWNTTFFAIRSTATGVEKNAMPTAYSLSQNYPNPFNPTTTIRYSILKRSLVTIAVYDLLGSKKAELIHREQQPGTYEIRFDGSSLASGVYFYRINAGTFSEEKKLLLLR
jgi:M6 family metalloprotease-like protein